MDGKKQSSWLPTKESDERELITSKRTVSPAARATNVCVLLSGGETLIPRTPVFMDSPSNGVRALF